MTNSSRLANADLIRVIAMLMVIMLHTILNFTVRPDFFSTKLYFLLTPITAISKTSVLLFFMLSGFLVIPKTKTIKENLIKTIRKIIVPLGFFTLINLILNWFEFASTNNHLGQFLNQEVNRMINFPSSPLWFLVILVYLYLLNPVWQLIFSQEQQKQLAKFLTMLSLLFSLIATLLEYLTKHNGQIFNNLTAWTAFLFFYLYGGLVRNKWIRIDQQKLNLTLILGGWLLTIIGDFMTMQQKISLQTTIWQYYTSSYLSLPVTLMAVGTFNYLLSIDLSKIKTTFLTTMAKLSFGIYLLHPYVIALLGQTLHFDFNQLQMNVYLYNFLNVTLVLLISSLLTLLLQKIPQLRIIIGG